MSLKKSLAEIETKYGKGAVIKPGDNFMADGVQRFSSGILNLDWAMGGGVPRGRIMEIYGPESSGKTTITLHCIAGAQVAFPEQMCAFVDAEHALDPVYATAIGVDFDRLLISQPDNGEQALEIVESLARSGEVPLIVVDSVAALTPRAEIEGDMGDAHMGLQARLISQAMRKLNGVLSKTDTTVIFINQLRQKIGIVFGNPETTPGGLALKFYASIRLDVRRKDQIKDGAEATGNKTRVNCIKNKVGVPFRKVEFDIMYGEGVSTEGVLLDLAVEQGLLVRGGAWYTDLKGEKLGQGKEKAKVFLQEHPDYLEELVAQVKENL